MKWKRFKKERISLNYTVMLLPHSQKKPIHFKTPVWTFGLFFLGLLILSGTSLFFAGSRLQLRQVRLEKEQLEVEKENLEQEWQLLAAEKQIADDENEALKQARDLQEQELRQLEQRTKDTIRELEELVERESQIRQELGLSEESVTDGQEAETTADGQGQPLSAAGQQSMDGQMVSSAGNQGPGRQPGSDTRQQIADMQTGSGTVPANGGEQTFSRHSRADTNSVSDGQFSQARPVSGISRTERTMSFLSIQSELNYLQDSLSQVSGQYEEYLDTIESKKQARAAAAARQEELRQKIVSDALRYVGNRYVYGGNDPHNGVDCSGFTRYILNHSAGVYLNRTAASQSAQGHSVSAEEARPGDLVFYSDGRHIDHVAIYIGDGRIVHASNENVGIITSNMYYRTPVKIRNVLGDK